MKKRLINLCAALCLFSPLALAGSTSDIFVEIDLEARHAKGNMLDARFSDNEFERIGCGISSLDLSDGSVSQQGWCQASLTKGENTICFTENWALLDSIKAIDDYSYISFRWDKEGDCSSIYVSTQSQYIPKNVN
ncbi:MAG: hypothetical protein KUG78_02755 [Kangiellaceae bacterium]|nr:hypothetical protein [Kangiellaceae bacterium]